MVSPKFTQTYKTMGSFKDNPNKKGNPTNDEQLDLYAYAKIAQGEDINAATKPGMFDLTGKAKRNAWQKKVDEGVTAKDAEAKYIQLGESLIGKYLK